MNFSKYYAGILNLNFDLIKYRPLLIISLHDKHRQFQRDVVPGSLCSGERTPLQILNRDDIPVFLNSYYPKEVHCSSTRFYETSFKNFVIDLDASKSTGISTVFDFAKGFGDHIRKHPLVEKVKILFTGNRGFHLHISLLQRKTFEETKALVGSFQDYQMPFIGVIDTNVLLEGHFIRMPFSFNTKGQKFSYFVDKLNSFNLEIAQEQSDLLYKGVTGE